MTCIATAARRGMCAMAVGIALLNTTPVFAAVHEVGVGVGMFNIGFEARDITINVGDTVRWTWFAGLHNVESGVAGVFDFRFRSGDPTFVKGTTFEFTFDDAFLLANPVAENVYPYYCVVHVLLDMSGTITIQQEAPCPADCADPADGVVNVTDLLQVLADWGTPGTCDTNGDNTTDVTDLLTVLGAWGACP